MHLLLNIAMLNAYLKMPLNQICKAASTFGGGGGHFCQNAYTVILIQKKAEKIAMHNLLLRVFMWLLIYSYTYQQI